MARALTPLSMTQLLAAQAEGACVIDVRDPDHYCRLHLRASINIGLRGNYDAWAGSLLDPQRPLVILADPGRESEAALRLGRIGFHQVLGYLEGGPAVLTPQDEWTDSLERIDGGELQERLAAADPPVIIDVRSPDEHAGGRVPGSLHVPLINLEERLGQVPQDRHVVVYCGSGYRSTIACSILKARGYHHLTDLAGGIQAWAGPIESD